jgi:MoaD family protein
MRVRVLAFARLREVLETFSGDLALPEGSNVSDALSALTLRYPALRELLESTRVARNGRVAALHEPLADGDEVALLPPVGGG